MNRYSIGIEIDNAGRLEKNGEEYTSWFRRSYSDSDVFEGINRNESTPSFWHRFTEEQVALVEEIYKLLVESYGIHQILGHEEISPRRKVGPGPAFPLDKMRDRIFRGDPLPKGTVVHIKDETDEWYEVVVESQGWVSKKFVKKV